MPGFPPSITAGSYTDVVAPDVKAPSKNAVSRSAFELPKRNSSNVQVCGVKELKVSTATASCDTSYKHGQSHGAIASDGSQRLGYEPGAESVTISWKLKGHASVTKVDVELFVPGVPGAIWAKRIEWDLGGCPETGSTTFDGRLLNNVNDAHNGAKSVTINGGYTPGDFPGDRLNAAKGPYKLRLTIPPDPTLRRDTPSRFVYLDAKPNTVTPHLEGEYKVALLQRGLDAHHVGAPAIPVPVTSPTRIELWLTQAQPGLVNYLGGGKLKRANANVDVFTDEACTVPLAFAGDDAVLTNAQLTHVPPTALYVKGTTAGRCDLELELDALADPHVRVEGPAKLEFGVVKIEMELHRYDLTVEPPTLGAMTDAQRIGEGRVLHVQSATNDHGRAKLVIKKLTAAEWPPGCDEYSLKLHHTNASGEVEVFDAETGGAHKRWVQRADALKADQVLWVQGKTAVDALRGVRVDIGIDRITGGLVKEVKRNADWATFTVVEVRKVTPTSQFVAPSQEYTNDQFKVYINLVAPPNGRKLMVKAELTRALAGIHLGITLLPEKNNGKAANNGRDLPKGWKPVDDALKHTPKDAAASRATFVDVTDANGCVEKEVTLSRFGGDVFWAAAYVAEDPLLADFVDGDKKLGKRKPTSSKKLHVWRKLWYQMTYAAGFNPPLPAPAVAAYKKVRIELEAAAGNPVTFPANSGPAGSWYPKWMIVGKKSVDVTPVSVLGDHNKAHFYNLFAAGVNEPRKVHVVVCENQWDPINPLDPNDPPPLKTAKITKSPSDEIIYGFHVLKPTLNGTPLVITAEYEHPTTKVWSPLVDADILVQPGRSDRNAVRIQLPVGAPVPTKKAPVNVRFKLQCAADYLGESIGPEIMAVYDDKNAVTIADFSDTVTHELGHAIHQVRDGGTHPPSVPNHPKAVNASNQGTHCHQGRKKCVMYDSGPQSTAIHEYCEVCHPYLVVEDVSTWKRRRPGTPIPA